MAKLEATMTVRLVLDGQARAALIALGWTPPLEPRPETPGDPDCPNAEFHGNPHRYCPCGWMEATP